MFFNLPVNIQLRILRHYIPLKDKYALLKLKPFAILLKDEYAWIHPPKISLSNIKLHDTYLLSAFKSGFYITPERRSVFQFLIDYKSASVTLLEFNSRKITYKRSFSIDKKYSVLQIHQCLTVFYTSATKVHKDHVYETWNRDIITFDPDTGIFNYGFFEECILIRCHFGVFRSLDFKTFLIYEGNRLTVFFAKNLLANNSLDLCSYLRQARSIGNEMFQYRFPAIAEFVTLVKAFSFKNSFKCTNYVKFRYMSQSHCIKCRFINRYDSYNGSQKSSYEIFNVYA